MFTEFFPKSQVVSLLVPTACKIFYSRIWNSILVPAAAQFFSTNSSILLSQHPLNLTGIIWLTQLQSKFLMMDPLNSTAVKNFDDGPITDQFRP